MTTAVEHFNNNIIDEDGDIRHIADVDSDTTPPPDNAFLIGRDYSLPKKRALEAERQAAAEWDAIEDKNPGPHVTMDQLPRVQRELMDTMSGIAMRRSFGVVAPVNPEIQDRYGTELPVVRKGAGKNLRTALHQKIPELYQADELIAAGFDEQEVMHDAKTTMRAEFTSKYGGPENAKEREAYRRQLNKKIDEQ